MSPVAPLEPWQSAWPALPPLLMLLAGLWGMRGALRPNAKLVGVLTLAVVVRAVILPLERHEFDGHEAEYLDLFLGVRGLSQGGTMLYPAMQWLCRGLGVVFAPHAGMLLAFSLSMGLVSIAALYGLVHRALGERAALGAAIALALWGNHAFWSVSAYNVILPHAMATLALWALAVGASGERGYAAGLVAGGAAALAVATRVESALVAPVGLLLLLALWRPGAWRTLPGLALGAGFGALCAHYVLYSGQTPGEEQRALAFSLNRGLLVYFAPFDHPVMLGLAGLGLVWGLWGAPRLFGPLFVLVVGTHLASASFDDYGFRHLLNAEAGLAAMTGALLSRRWGAIPYGLVLLGLGLHTRDVAQRFYATEDDFAATVQSFPPLSWEEVRACTLVCEDSRVVPEEQQRSHFNLLDPAEAEAMRAETGCIYWLYGVQDYRWSSRAVRDRALRLERLYDMQVRGVVQDSGRGYVALVLEPLQPGKLSEPMSVQPQSWRQ